MAQKAKQQSSHLHFPFQFILGVLFVVAGGLLLMKKFGRDLLPVLPETVLIYICATGSFLGGLYLIIHKLWRPRIYL